MKTSELIGAQLDWAVAKCEMHDIVIVDGAPKHLWGKVPFDYSTNWSQGGPIIDREGLSILTYDNPSERRWEGQIIRNTHWIDQSIGEGDSRGPTALVAAMRCYVASELGDEVELPEGLK